MIAEIPKGKTKDDRVDQFGRAFAGSQRHIQTCVNLRPLELAELILAGISPNSALISKIRWVSPLAAENFTEYRDEEFLRILGISKYSLEMQKFWPKGGPSWDALGILESPSGKGVILVEAKSHIGELKSKCGATAPRSIKKIQVALEVTKKQISLSIPESANWMEPFYQAANRLAFVNFLRSVGIEAWLVNVYFLKDGYFKDSPRSENEWSPAIEELKEALGIKGETVPFTIDLFLDVPTNY